MCTTKNNISDLMSLAREILVDVGEMASLYDVSLEDVCCPNPVAGSSHASSDGSGDFKNNSGGGDAPFRNRFWLSVPKRTEMIFFDAQSHFQLSSFLQLVSGLDAFTTPVEPLQNGTSHAISTWISLNVFGFSKWTNFFNVDQLADLERCWRMNSCYCGNDPGCLSNCPRKKVMILTYGPSATLSYVKESIRQECARVFRLHSQCARVFRLHSQN